MKSRGKMDIREQESSKVHIKDENEIIPVSTDQQNISEQQIKHKRQVQGSKSLPTCSTPPRDPVEKEKAPLESPSNDKKCQSSAAELLDGKPEPAKRSQLTSPMDSLQRNTSQGRHLFKCNLCDYTGTNRYNLKRHSDLKHKDIKPFKCISCSYTSNFEPHVKIHYSHVHSKGK